MLGRDRHALFPRRGRRHLARLHVDLRVAEYPRVANCPPTDHHGVDAGLLEHRVDPLRVESVAVPDQRDVADAFLLDLPEPLPPRLARVLLLPRPGVDGQRADPDRLQHPGDLDDLNRVLVPTQPRLHGHRPVGFFDHRLRDLFHLREAPKNAGAPVLRHDFSDRTPEVDVDHVRLDGVHDRRRAAHLVDLSAPHLDADGTLFVEDLELLVRPLHVAQQAGGRHEFGVEHVRPVALAQDTEWGIAHVFHRSEEERPIAEFERTDAHIDGGLRNVRRFDRCEPAPFFTCSDVEVAPEWLRRRVQRSGPGPAFSKTSDSPAPCINRTRRHVSLFEIGLRPGSPGLHLLPPHAFGPCLTLVPPPRLALRTARRATRLLRPLRLSPSERPRCFRGHPLSVREWPSLG